MVTSDLKFCVYNFRTKESPKMRIAIYDNSLYINKQLVYLLKKYEEIKKICFSINSFHGNEVILSNKPNTDIAFLCVCDSVKTEIIRKFCLENSESKIIIVANIPDYRYAFQFHAFDFIPLPIREPGTVIGRLKKEIQEQVGFDCEIVLPATHDTGSAVVAVPSNEEHVLYISSGTWSLMGTELKEADCGTEAMQHNFTNEGGYNRKYRFLKNIMGLWMVQSVKKEIAEDLSFGTICEMASKCTIPSIVDANDDRFLAPEHMTAEVQKACEESGQQIPQGIAEVAAVIYNSLAVCYAKTLKELEEKTGCRYRTIHVVGGGANAGYLNRLTAEKTGRTVLAGPTEATAIGNLAVQMITGKECSNLKDARNCIFHSFEIKQYES